MKDYKEIQAEEAAAKKPSLKKNDIINKLHSLSPDRFTPELMEELVKAMTDVYKKHNIDVLHEEEEFFKKKDEPKT